MTIIAEPQIEAATVLAEVPPCQYVRGAQERCNDPAVWRIIFGCDTHDHSRVTLACDRHRERAAEVEYPAAAWRQVGRKPACSGTWRAVAMESMR